MNKQSVRKQGVVERFDSQRGFGFIRTYAGEDLFVHFDNIGVESFPFLEPGYKVSFYVVETRKGLRAVDVYVKCIFVGNELQPCKTEVPPRKRRASRHRDTSIFHAPVLFRPGRVTRSQATNRHRAHLWSG